MQNRSNYKMKKIVASTVLSGALVSNVFAFDFGSIIGKYNPLEQMNNLTGVEAFGMCYKRQAFTLDVCSLIPSLESVGLDGCSMLPNIPGFNKRSANLDLDANNYLKNYCQPAAKKINSVIADVEIYGSDVLNGKKKYPGGDTPQEFYNNSVKNILSNNSVVKNGFMNNNQKVINDVLSYAKTKGTQDLTKVTPDNLMEGVPKDYNEYLSQRDGLSKLMIADEVSNSPTQVSNSLASKLDGKQGAAAKNVASEYVQKNTQMIDDNTQQRIGFEIDLQRKDTDLAIPLQDSINYYRDDIKPEKIAQLKDQIRREAKIQSEVLRKDKLRADIVSLVAQKTVIMNEKFDRAAAQNEIEALLK